MNNVILVPFQSVRRIIHLADIHVRLFKRHEEYRQCFTQLYSDLKATDLDRTVIVVAGDIVHSKTDLSPEMVALASDFLGKLADLAPTLLIAGNHDLNVSNKQRLDALTPIVQNLKNPNLHYLRESGIYTCADIDFYVYSILGDEVDWPKPHHNGRHKIALYHGPVHNATTDIGYTITNKHVTTDIFTGFDMVMLGDIHRHQVLKEQNPIVVYPGSLIQQDHGEAIKGHGWCDWDIASRSFIFRELKNRYGYYTLTLGKNGEVPTYVDMPENVRLRIFAGALEQSEIKKLVSVIRSKYNVTDLVVSSFTGVKSTTLDSGGRTFLDIHQVDVQNQLLTDYIKGALPETSEETLQRVIDLNGRLNSEISSEDPTRKLIWRPLSLHFDNLFTYGEGNFINFENLKGVAGVFAPNASGKTSLPDALCFALYDRTPRTIKAANIMNTRATKCFCKLRLEIDGLEYVIERRGAKNKKGEVKIDVDFFRVNADGSTTSLNGEERRYTNANIRNYVGDYEDFVLTAFSTQGQNSLFVDRGQSDRKDLLSQFMGLTIFDKLHLLANDESKEVAGALKRFKGDDFTQELVDTEQKIIHEELMMDTAQRMVDEIQGWLERDEDSIRREYAQLIPVNIKYDQPTLHARLNTALEHQKLIESQATAFSDTRFTIQGRIDFIKRELENAGNIEEQYQKATQVSKLFEKADLEGKRTQQKLESVTSTIWRLREHKYDPNCEFCITNGKKTIEDLAKAESEHAVLTNQLELHENGMSMMAQEMKTYEGVSKRYQDFTAARSLLAKYENELLRHDASYTKLAGDWERAKHDVEAALRDINEYTASLDAIEANAKIQERIKTAQGFKAQRQQDLRAKQKVVSDHKTNIALFNKAKNDMLTKIREAEELETKYETYDVYLKAVCRDGLPYKLISEVLPMVENEVNVLLSQMVDFTLLFESDGKNINIKLCYGDDRLWPLELASGMEKFISGLAIRVALMEVSSLPKSNFLIVDEGFGALDPENLASIFKLFEMLRHNFDFILVISHVDGARDIADILIDIQRTDGLSKVEVY